MIRFQSRCGCLIVALGVLVVGAGQSLAGGDDVLTNLGTTIVYTEYAYPQGEEPGVLTINDQGLGLIATFLDDTELLFSDISVSLSLELLEELGDPGDAFAYGQFGSGVLTYTDNSAPGPGTTIFQADVLEFELVESALNSGVYSGDGTFENATFSGALAGVTLPTEGQILTSLFQWFSDSDLTALVDIDNFLNPADQGASTVYGELTQVNVTPEPGTLVLLGVAVAGMLRRRRTA